MRRIKCYIGNYDGRRQGLILAFGRADACEILGCSAKDFRDFWVERSKASEEEDFSEQGVCETRVLYTRLYGRILWEKGHCELK